MRKFLVTLSLLFIFSFPVSPVLAQYGTTTYNYSIFIDKTVATPNASNTNSNSYIDNLSPSDPRFKAGNDVYFKIRVKNTSDNNLTTVWIRDYVPTYILPIEGPGSWDLENRVLSWNAGDFGINEEKTYYLKMRVYDKSMLPSDKGLFCITNRAEAKNDVAYDDDSSQICIEKTVLGVSTVPSAGPELGILLFGGELMALGTGLFLKKKSLYFEKKG